MEVIYRQLSASNTLLENVGIKFNTVVFSHTFIYFNIVLNTTELLVFSNCLTTSVFHTFYAVMCLVLCSVLLLMSDSELI